MRFFQLSPTFFSFLAGTFISTATALWIGVILTPPSHPTRLHLAGLGFAIAAVNLLILATLLEAVRSRANGSDLSAHIRDARAKLIVTSIASALSIGAGMICVVWAQ